MEIRKAVCWRSRDHLRSSGDGMWNGGSNGIGIRGASVIIVEGRIRAAIAAIKHGQAANTIGISRIVTFDGDQRTGEIIQVIDLRSQIHAHAFKYEPIRAS